MTSAEAPAPEVWKSVLRLRRTWAAAAFFGVAAAVVGSSFMLSLAWVAIAAVFGATTAVRLWRTPKSTPESRLRRGRFWAGLAVAGVSTGWVVYAGLCYRVRIERRMAPLIAAIDHYQRDHRAWPTRTEDLVPRYLPAIPACPYHTLLDTFGPWGVVEPLGSPARPTPAQPPPSTLGCGTPRPRGTYAYSFASRRWMD